MYALANVTRFLDDNKDNISPQKKDAVLRRARHLSRPDGILFGGDSGEVWSDETLAAEFGRALMSSVDHMDIGVAAIRAAR